MSGTIQFRMQQIKSVTDCSAPYDTLQVIIMRVLELYGTVHRGSLII